MPEDVALVGFDDLEAAALTQPPLTTVRQPTRRTGMAAVETLLDVIENGDEPVRRIIMPTQLIVRESCGEGFQHQDVAPKVRCFVPLDETLEIWQLAVRNDRAQAVALSLFSFVEFALWDAWDDATNYQRNFNIGEVEIDGGVIYHKTEYRERRDHFAYFACSQPLAGYDTSLEAFLGPYGSLRNPQVVAQGRSTHSQAHGWASIGSHHVQIKLQPGESRQVIFLLGYYENPPD